MLCADSQILAYRSPQRLPNAHAEKEITSEKFSAFLEWLSPDLDRAGEEYERMRFRLVTFFSRRQCSRADELADETINRLILKVAEQKIEHKLPYCYGVAKNVYRESLRKERPHLAVDEVTIAAKYPDEKSFSNECLDKCLKKLSPESCDLLFEYFSEAKQAKIELHRHICESMGLTPTALRMKVSRLMQKLRICVRECMT